MTGLGSLIRTTLSTVVFVLIISSDDHVLIFLLFTKWISIAGFHADRFGYNSAEVMLRDFHPKGHT